MGILTTSAASISNVLHVYIDHQFKGFIPDDFSFIASILCHQANHSIELRDDFNEVWLTNSGPFVQYLRNQKAQPAMARAITPYISGQQKPIPYEKVFRFLAMDDELVAYLQEKVTRGQPERFTQAVSTPEYWTSDEGGTFVDFPLVPDSDYASFMEWIDQQLDEWFKE